MGQAVVDLPDPLDMPPPASMSGTDDLLAQLAGDEIDRLLAETDTERPAPAAPEGAAPAPAAADATSPKSELANDNTAASPVAQVSAEPASAEAVPQTAHAPTSAPPSAPPATANAGVLEDDLDSLLSELNQAGSAPSVAPPSSGADADSSTAAAAKPKSLVEQVPEVLAHFGAAAAATPSAPESADGLMSTAERDALNLSNLSDETAAAEQQDAAAAAVAATDAAESNVQTSRALRPAVRVLEWVNAPLSFVPDAARDTLGKVAILTLVNSLAVLIYVLFVRH